MRGLGSRLERVRVGYISGKSIQSWLHLLARLRDLGCDSSEFSGCLLLDGALDLLILVVMFAVFDIEARHGG